MKNLELQKPARRLPESFLITSYLSRRKPCNCSIINLDRDRMDKKPDLPQVVIDEKNVALISEDVVKGQTKIQEEELEEEEEEIGK
ncbi:hypothetical protein M8J76_003969 [Diaphorina citri]|nr:hypothetical protein M8J76_003969 [Diaphorina citri]